LPSLGNSALTSTRQKQQGGGGLVILESNLDLGYPSKSDDRLVKKVLRLLPPFAKLSQAGLKP